MDVGRGRGEVGSEASFGRGTEPEPRSGEVRGEGDRSESGGVMGPATVEGSGGASECIVVDKGKDAWGKAGKKAV